MREGETDERAARLVGQAHHVSLALRGGAGQCTARRASTHVEVLQHDGEDVRSHELDDRVQHILVLPARQLRELALQAARARCASAGALTLMLGMSWKKAAQLKDEAEP